MRSFKKQKEKFVFFTAGHHVFFFGAKICTRRAWDRALRLVYSFARARAPIMWPVFTELYVKFQRTI